MRVHSMYLGSKDVQNHGILIKHNIPFNRYVPFRRPLCACLGNEANKLKILTQSPQLRHNPKWNLNMFMLTVI